MTVLKRNEVFKRAFMTAAEFVKRLEKFIPDIEELKNRGYDEDDIKLSIDAWKIERFKDCKSLTSNPLIELAECYQTYAFEILGININNEINEFKEFLEVGVYHQYPYLLVVHKNSNEVIVYNDEENEESSISFICAENGSKFLSALIHGFEVSQGSKVGKETVMECAELAGGDKYQYFWRYILGQL